jgi:heme exporter protein A
MTAIELVGLSRSYGERVALRDLTLSVAEGQTLVVFGPNGAGKTTLLRILATLLRPHAGTARVLGRELPDDGWSVRGRIGFVAHDPLLYRDLSARENLVYHARLHGVGERRVESVLEQVGMARRADEPVRTLSRGMVQRIAVSRAVLHEPEVLLLDEPLANLDPRAAALVEPLIDGATRVMTSHDPARALEHADVALGLRGGRAEWVAPGREIDARQVEGLYR